MNDSDGCVKDTNVGRQKAILLSTSADARQSSFELGYLRTSVAYLSQHLAADAGSLRKYSIQRIYKGYIFDDFRLVDLN